MNKLRNWLLGDVYTFVTTCLVNLTRHDVELNRLREDYASLLKRLNALESGRAWTDQRRDA